jgi:hypothetical protein
MNHPLSRGNQVSNILNPANGYRGNLERKGIKPKDHMKDNLKKIKEKEVEVKEKNESKNEPKNVFKLSQFQNIASTVKINMEKMIEEEATRDKKPFMKSGIGELRREEKKLTKQIQVLEDNEKERQQFVTMKKPPVPSASSSAAITSRTKDQKNYINQNARSASQTRTVRKQLEDKDEALHESYGKVPQYIVDRKRIQDEEEERIREEEERRNSCPPGMVLMPEDERLETLKVLNDNKIQIGKDTHALPIICDTIGLKRKKAILEAKMQEVEDAIKIFSRAKVYIAE